MKSTMPPEGILLTLPKIFFLDRKMHYRKFMDVFERHMSAEGSYWNFKLTNLPRHDVLHVYLVFDGFIQYKCNLMCYQRNISKSFKDSADQRVRHFKNCNWILFTGPVVKVVNDSPTKGFQGFRYTQQEIF
jgi:hypothetical protein